ncbi:DEAD-box ATP-dependent RNA helicase 53, mitochondrial isoform X2 [Lingula anatina]|uniref:RNA helicase n=1 Tax=Lingula anatina TaxID=7574 RepID=A0A1S3HAK1_LINAN|nr:DEAD-box ATP-dependent RNA helicase 53, mitochondrial isoform X2 [Lingula anatina]|eukprot:XP_013383033.1 DEAD-box ATP-dependent RNA helicase 53, mitochondrial isoform X2 [Lingula anatina]
MSATLRARFISQARGFLSVCVTVPQRHVPRLLQQNTKLLVTSIQRRLISRSSVLSVYGQGRPYLDEDGEEFADIDETEVDKLRRDQRAYKEEDQHDKWSNYDIDEELIETLEDLGYSAPFEIQSKTLKPLLEGKNVIGKAATGSGKTLAFGIPIIELIMRSGRLERGFRRKPCHPLAVVIAPTRELCLQNYRCIMELNPKVRCVPVYGGNSISVQMDKLRAGVDVVLATPGRLMDLINRSNCNLSEMKLLCLDEGDHLLNPQFRDDIESVLQLAKKQSQSLVFSATMPRSVRQVANEYITDVEYVDIADAQEKNMKHVQHCELLMPREKMLAAVSACIREYCHNRCIVFLATKVQTKEVAMALSRGGHSAKAINSNLSQNSREQILKGFRMGKIKSLVATDVAARGLDVPEVDLVIQVDPPTNGLDYYIHRSGRTGRAGRQGYSILIHPGEGLSNSLSNVIREIRQQVDIRQIECPEITDSDLKLRSEAVLRGPPIIPAGGSRKRNRFGSWSYRSVGQSRGGLGDSFRGESRGGYNRPYGGNREGGFRRSGDDYFDQGGSRSFGRQRGGRKYDDDDDVDSRSFGRQRGGRRHDDNFFDEVDSDSFDRRGGFGSDDDEYVKY